MNIRMLALIKSIKNFLTWGSTDEGIINGPEINLNKLLRQTIPEIFHQKLSSKQICSTKIAVQYGDYQTLTFQQVDIFSSAIAKNLNDKIGYSAKCKNPDSDLLIAVCMSPSEKLITLLFGILKTGAGYIPLDPDYPEEFLLLILKAFQPLLLVVDDNGAISNKFDPQNFMDVCSMVSVEELWLDMELPSKMQVKSTRKMTMPKDMLLTVDVPDKGSEKPVVVLQTVGFEKVPQGVRISHRNVVNHIISDWQILGLKDKVNCTLTFPISTIESTLQIFTSLIKGCTLNIFKRTDLMNMNYFTELLSARKVNRISLYNYQLHYFLTAIDTLGRKETLRRLGKLKCVICRGDILTRPDVRWFFKIFKDGVYLVNSIGPAEATGTMVYEKFNSVKEFDSKLILGRLTLSRVCENSRIYTLGHHNEIVNDGNQGEICCSGFNVALGYVNEAAMDKDSKFQANPQHIKKNQFNRIFHTGEYGRICVNEDDSSKRHLYIEGRSDRGVKHKGHLFSVDDVKSFLLGLPIVQEAAVLVYHQGRFDQELIAFVSLKTPSKSEGDAPKIIMMLEELAKEKLPEFAIPDEFKIVDEIPTTPTGKPFAAQLLLQYEQNREPNFSVMDSQELGLGDRDREFFNAKKRLLSAMYKFASIPIELSMANVDSSMFEIGVTSLNALSILLHLQHLGYPITLMEFLKSKDVNEVIKVMVEKQKERGSDHDVSLAYYVVNAKDNYIIDPISRKHKSRAVELLAHSYARSGYLQPYNLVTYKQYLKFFSDNWKTFEDAGISFIVRRKSDHKIIAVALNVDFFQIIDTSKAEGALFHIIEFIHEIKGNCIDQIPKRKSECFENQWMATEKSLSPVENLMLITQMETEVLKLAKQNYSCIFSACFSPLTKRLCQDIFGYRVMDIYLVNEYMELDRSRPFKLAPDTVTIAACFFHIKTPEPISSLSSMTTDLTQEELMKYMS